MRLLNSRTLELESFSTPPKGYAILSHRWEKDEVSFQDMQSGQAQAKSGFRKIRAFCDRAAEDGFAYCWADTCCIDKSSSAELSEAINSMFVWYKKAEICYAYLSDVSNIESLEESQWFERGWTLQELVAPKYVGFYNSSWSFLGSKSSLCSRLSLKTTIHKDILFGRRDIESATIAQRMSWAAYRKTTREEDMAYCLMGIFDVNMPLLYGEGTKAFRRLQEAILTKSDDHSLLAWQGSYYGCGGLAPSPIEFRYCGNIVPYFELQRDESSPWTMTNLGLRVELPVYDPDPSEDLYKPGTCIAVLNCSIERDFTGPKAIRLRGLSSRCRDQFSRGEDIYELLDLDIVRRARLRTVYIREDKGRIPTHKPAFLIRKRPIPALGYSLREVHPAKQFDESQMAIKSPCTTAALTFAQQNGAMFIVMVGSCWCRVVSGREIPMTQQPLLEARELLRNYKNEVTNRVYASRSAFTSTYLSKELQLYAAECEQRPEFGEQTLNSWVPDYDKLFASSRSMLWSESKEHTIVLSGGLTVTARIDRSDVMGESMMVVDVTIQTLPSNVYEHPSYTAPGQWNQGLPYHSMPNGQNPAKTFLPMAQTYPPAVWQSAYDQPQPPAELPG